jgi:hypothetical protein
MAKIDLIIWAISFFGRFARVQKDAPKKAVFDGELMLEPLDEQMSNFRTDRKGDLYGVTKSDWAFCRCSQERFEPSAPPSQRTMILKTHNRKN